MGYCMEVLDIDFFIAAKDKAAAFSYIQHVLVNLAELKRVDFDWVNSDGMRESTTLEEMLKVWRWDPLLDKKGNIHFLDFTGEKFGDDNVLFRHLAPFVKAGSYIAMIGEDNAIWRWYFDGSECIEQEGRVEFDV